MNWTDHQLTLLIFRNCQLGSRNSEKPFSMSAVAFFSVEVMLITCYKTYCSYKLYVQCRIDFPLWQERANRKRTIPTATCRCTKKKRRSRCIYRRHTTLLGKQRLCASSLHKSTDYPPIRPPTLIFSFSPATASATASATGSY